MLKENELKNTVVSVEQRLKELDQLRERDKHDPINLKKWADQIALEKIKLQVLHYSEGINERISEKCLRQVMLELKNNIHELERPREGDLFGVDESKELGRQLLTARVKLEMLNYILGVTKKIP